MTAIAKFGPLSDEVYRRDLLDNNTDYLVVGDKTVDRMVLLEYSFELPIANRAHVGTLEFNHNGTSIVVVNEYTFLDPVIDGIEFGADFNGNQMRLVIVTSGLGENPTIKYRRSSIGVV